jgi:spoIIIJ-associated protein
MKKDDNQEKIKLTEELANKLLLLMGTTAKARVSEDAKNEALRIEIEADEERGLLIGRHGETLKALQTIVGMMIYQKTGEWTRVLVDIGDWREKQEQQIRELAIQTAQRARETGTPQFLFNLTPAERRIIHLELAEKDDVETESKGEDKERYLIVKPKTKTS